MAAGVGILNYVSLLPHLLQLSATRVIRIPEEFDPFHPKLSMLSVRDVSTGCVKGLQSCGASFPSDFCCPSNTQCLPLNGTGTTAVICCPFGGTCSTIIPISCDRRAQDPHISPQSEIHASPTLELEMCGDDGACCPMGYSCDAGRCRAIIDLAETSLTSEPSQGSLKTSTTTMQLSMTSVVQPSSSSSSSTPTFPSATTATAQRVPHSSTTTTSMPISASTSITHSTTHMLTRQPSTLSTSTRAIISTITIDVGGTPETNQSHAAAAGDSGPSNSSFSGGTFAAGFIPGIVIGALAVMGLVLFLVRRKMQQMPKSQNNEKNPRRDTLTDLSIMPPPSHGRLISVPTTDPRFGFRSDFLRSTPPRSTLAIHSFQPDEEVQSETGDSTTTIKRLFSHSPFVQQTPSTPKSSSVPTHLKRGTLSFRISPVRALKKQRSMHSLRRQMTEGARTIGSNRSNSDSTWRSNQTRSRSQSTETIKVLMPSSEPYTPDRRMQMPTITTSHDDMPSYDLPDSATTWETDDSTMILAASEYERSHTAVPTDPTRDSTPHQTPTRPPICRPPHSSQPAEGLSLGSPYTPSDLRPSRAAISAAHQLYPAPIPAPLAIRRADTRRVTTCSTIVKGAGLGVGALTFNPKSRTSKG